MFVERGYGAVRIVKRGAKGTTCPFCGNYEAAADHPSTKGYTRPGNYIFDCEGCDDSFNVHIPEKRERKL